MFRATHRSSSGAKKLYLQPLVLHTSVVADRQPQTYVKPGATNKVFAPDDERCVARNMLSNKKRWNNKF